MDGTFDEYMMLNISDSWDLIKKLIDIVEKNRGVFTILWHNSEMLDDKLKLYEKILEYSKEKNAWMTSGEEIWKWWEKNKYWNI